MAVSNSLELQRFAVENGLTGEARLKAFLQIASCTFNLQNLAQPDGGRKDWPGRICFIVILVD